MSIPDVSQVCPSCGSPAGKSRFCASCGQNLERFDRLPSHAEWEATRETGWSHPSIGTRLGRSVRARSRAYGVGAGVTIVAIAAIIVVLASGGGSGQGLTQDEAATAAQRQFIANDKSDLPNFGFASVNDGTLQTQCLPSQDPQTEPGWYCTVGLWMGFPRPQATEQFLVQRVDGQILPQDEGSCNSIRNLGPCNMTVPTTQAQTIDGP